MIMPPEDFYFYKLVDGVPVVCTDRDAWIKFMFDADAKRVAWYSSRDCIVSTVFIGIGPRELLFETMVETAHDRKIIRCGSKWEAERIHNRQVLLSRLRRIRPVMHFLAGLTLAALLFL